jgi:protein involved in polysaccharide export with SLBB domain
VGINHFDHGVFMGEQELVKQKQVSGLPVCVLFVAILAVTVTAALTGCSDPTFVGRFRAVPVTNIILDSLGVVDEEPEQFAYARDPYPKDLIVEEREYVVQRGDMIEISILDLFMSGAEWRNRLQVSETGRVTVPEIGTFRVAGRTEFEIADDIKNLLRPHILKNPTVNVVVIASTKKVFSISGAIAASGRYQLIQSDFRILEAIAQAGGVPQTGIDYVYVVRKISDEDLEEIESQLDTDYYEDSATGYSQPMPPASQQEEPSEMRTRGPRDMINDEYSPGQTEQRQQELIQAIPPAPISEKDEPPEPIIEPTQREPEVTTPPEPKEPEPNVTEPPISSEPTQPEPKVVEPSMSPQPELKEPEEPEESEEPKPTSEQEWDKLLESIRPMTEIAMPKEEAEPKKKLKIIRGNGKFQLIPVDQKTAGQERIEEPLTPERPWRTPSRQGMEGLGGQHQEVIQVDLKALQSGDMTQNVVIRSGDYIQVPYNDIGVFYVMGQVSRPGPYSLQGQRMTLKQVISVAGPLSPLANMNCCDITRRIGRDKEVTCRLNLQKLIEGSQPDIFIKPNDIINIGSHPVARWVAVVRQSFRSTYGFGFVYDRNLADRDFGH